MESAGARLQEGAAALGGFGRIFFENVALSGRAPQISVITGVSAGGGCYSPALTDFVVMTDKASMFLTGPRIVKQALGEDVTTAALGGTRVHARNGVCDFVAGDDRSAMRCCASCWATCLRTGPSRRRRSRRNPPPARTRPACCRRAAATTTTFAS